MKKRLAILADHRLKLSDITDVIATIDPLDGALDFLTWLRKQTQVIIVSDTFTQFAGPLMEKLLLPTLFCNTLTIGDDGAIVDYNLRQKEGKRQTVLALRSLNYHITAMGDSYNDTGMLAEADVGILFRPPENVVREFPQFPVVTDYDALRTLLADSLAK